MVATIRNEKKDRTKGRKRSLKGGDTARSNVEVRHLCEPTRRNKRRQTDINRDKYRQTLPNRQMRTRGNRQRDTKRRNEIETNDRHGHIETNRDKQRQTETTRETERHRQTDRDREAQTPKRNILGYTEMHKDRQRKTEITKQIDTGTRKQTGRHRDRQRYGDTRHEIFEKFRLGQVPKFPQNLARFLESRQILKKFAGGTSGNLRAASPEASQNSGKFGRVTPREL